MPILIVVHHPHTLFFSLSSLGVDDNNGGLADRSGGQNLAVLEDVDEGAAAGADVARAAVRVGVGEADGAEVGKGHQAAVVLLEVLDDPLGVDLAQGLGLRGEGVGDLGALGPVYDGSNAGCLGGGLHRDGHDVADSERDAGEGVAVFMLLVRDGSQEAEILVIESREGLTHSQDTTRTTRRMRLGPSRCKSPSRSAGSSWSTCRRRCPPTPRWRTRCCCCRPWAARATAR